MSKIIVERPRLGGGLKTPKGARRALQRCDVDELPRRQGIRRPWRRDSKGLNENLAPLRRFLGRNVGRPWNKVFSEICEHICIDSAVQKHIRDHLDDFVARYVEVVGREVRVKPGSRWTRADFYVHPRTGLLRWNPNRWRRHRHVAEPKSYLAVDAMRQIRRVDGLWYEVELAWLPRAVPAFDVVERRLVHSDWPTESHLQKKYGAVVYACRKRQLSSREIHHHRAELERIDQQAARAGV
ncbi:MAG TPA: hypothetical protein VGM03_18280 [Phycisphaerae bacterium]|jgi:hypothetical protein